MDNPIVNCFKALWSCVIGSLRMILFIICLLSLISGLGYAVLRSAMHDDTIQPIEDFFKDKEDSHYGFKENLLMMAVLALGCYGSLYKHRLCLFVFSVVIILFSFYTIGSVTSYYQTRKSQDDLKTELYSNMSQYQAGGKNNATKLWDALQQLNCCGVDGPGDWEKYSKPIPDSCCSKFESNCNKHSVFFHEQGCLAAIEKLEAFALLSGLLSCCVYFILGLIGIVVGFHCTKDEPSACSPNLIESGHANPVQGYSRFTSTFFARPPQTTAYGDQASAPSIYPTADVQKEFSTPPPVYKPL